MIRRRPRQPTAPGVVGYLRFLIGSKSPMRDDMLRATAAG
jgi:hypothetical protein